MHCRKLNYTTIWLSRKTNETKSFKIKTWRGFNPTILKVNKFNVIESKFTQYLTLNLMLPPVKLTNMITCSSNSTDSSLLDLQHTSSHTYHFKIPLKCFKSPVGVDLIAATRFYQHLIINLVLVDTCRVRRL